MRSSLVAALVTCAVLVAGCGSSGSSGNEADKSADQILADAQAAVKDAKSVRVSGTGSTGGAPYRLDLSVVAGSGGKGIVALNGAGFQVVRIGNKAYFKGDSTFLKAVGGPGADRFAGRWFVVPADNPKFAGLLSQFTDLGKLTGAFVTPPGALTKGAQVKVRGQPAISLVDTADDVTLYVAATGTPYPLELSTTTGKPGGIATPAAVIFSGWDKPVVLVAPKNAIEFSKLAS